MTKEEKSILFQDLCARLPYHVRVKIWLKDGTTEEGSLDLQHNYADVLLGAFYYNKIVDIKPYLRPISSMTEKEKEEYDSFLFDNLEKEDVIGYEDKAFGVDVIMRYRSWEVVQWLLEHHLDFNGLIDLGLALEASEGMYEY